MVQFPVVGIGQDQQDQCNKGIHPQAITSHYMTAYGHHKIKCQAVISQSLQKFHFFGEDSHHCQQLGYAKRINQR